MAVVDSIALYFVSYPLPAPFTPAWVPNGTRTSSSFYLIRIRTDEGVEGFSAFPSSGSERAGLGQVLARLLLGKDPTDIDGILAALRVLSYAGHREFWIEPAFWDIKGKMAGKPVYELLGGTAKTLKLYISTGEMKGPEARIEEAHARYEEGFRCLKMRVHAEDEADDIRQIQETARAFEGKMNFAVDCNQAYPFTAAGPVWDLARAKRFCDAAHEVKLRWVEEPLFMEKLDDMAALTAYSKVPVSGGELHTGGYTELAQMVDKRCYSIFQPDTIWTGGIQQTVDLAKYVRKAGLQFTAHTWSTGIGFAVNHQVMLATDFAGELDFEYPYNPPGLTIEARDMLLKQPIQHVRGELPAPTAPGLGFEIDEQALARYGRCFFQADRKTVVWKPELLSNLAPQAAFQPSAIF